MTPASRTRTRIAVADPACAEAVELARSAASEQAGSPVGEYQGFVAEGDRLGSHLFASTDRAYAGWHWAVSVARASRARGVTVDEVVLLPGEGALQAPEWVPWSERVRPGDLGVGDLLVTAAEDERLAPTYAAGDDPEEEAVALELGFGRVRVLSLEGRDDAADRWYDGPAGPTAPVAQAAPARCGTCGFYLRIGGGLGPLFGACANEYAPDDGRVVSADHGCGAHSEAVVLASTPERVPTLVDDYRFEEVGAEVATATPVTPEEPTPTDPAPAVVPSAGSVDDAETGEPLGHS